MPSRLPPAKFTSLYCVGIAYKLKVAYSIMRVGSFKKANFKKATFKKASFKKATFKKASFKKASFKKPFINTKVSR
jgi:uncharacterized protein YjbI with pentapeptide repeats